MTAQIGEVVCDDFIVKKISGETSAPECSKTILADIRHTIAKTLLDHAQQNRSTFGVWLKGLLD